MKILKKTGLIMIILFILPSVFAVSAAEVNIKSNDLGSKTITIDGAISDWSDYTASDLELKDPLNDADTQVYTAKIKIAHDDSDIYFLIQIDDKYQAYNFSSGNFVHEQTVALGVSFNINGSSRHMGSESASSQTVSAGYADIMHWELETAAGVVNTGSAAGVNKGNSPTNMDDEWANKTTSRYDDKVDNPWTGVWEHTAKTNGSAGTYIFEMKRKLTNSDPMDVQFEMNKKYEITIAYWTPFETADGWTDSGHYTSSHVDGFIILGSLPTSPGFEVSIALISLMATILIISKKKRN